MIGLSRSTGLNRKIMARLIIFVVLSLVSIDGGAFAESNGDKNRVPDPPTSSPRSVSVSTENTVPLSGEKRDVKITAPSHATVISTAGKDQKKFILDDQSNRIDPERTNVVREGNAGKGSADMKKPEAASPTSESEGRLTRMSGWTGELTQGVSDGCSRLSEGLTQCVSDGRTVVDRNVKKVAAAVESSFLEGTRWWNLNAQHLTVYLWHTAGPLLEALREWVEGVPSATSTGRVSSDGDGERAAASTTRAAAAAGGGAGEGQKPQFSASEHRLHRRRKRRSRSCRSVLGVDVFELLGLDPDHEVELLFGGWPRHGTPSSLGNVEALPPEEEAELQRDVETKMALRHRHDSHDGDDSHDDGGGGGGNGSRGEGAAHDSLGEEERGGGGGGGRRGEGYGGGGEQKSHEWFTLGLWVRATLGLWGLFLRGQWRALVATAVGLGVDAANDGLVVVRAVMLLLTQIPLVYYATCVVVLCASFGSWTMLRLPILVCVCLSLVIEFQVYWWVRFTIHTLELLPKVRSLAWWLPLPIPSLRFSRRQRHLTRAMLDEAQDFETWKELAVEMDVLHAREGWKDVAEDPRYHSKLVIAATQRLKRARSVGDWVRVMETLKPTMVKNFGGSMNLSLYSQTHVGTKRVVEELFVEIEASLDWLMTTLKSPEDLFTVAHRQHPPNLWSSSSSTGSALSPGRHGDTQDEKAASSSAVRRSARKKAATRTSTSKRRGGSKGARGDTSRSNHGKGGTGREEEEGEGRQELEPRQKAVKSAAASAAMNEEWERFVQERLSFFKAAKRSFGNTAFLMSGGATLGLYHIGVIKALVARGNIPKVICGTSAGSVLTAFLAVRTDEEIMATFADSELSEWWAQFGPSGPFRGSWLWKLRQLHKKGRMYDYKDFMEHLSWFVGEYPAPPPPPSSPQASAATGTASGAASSPKAATSSSSSSSSLSPTRRKDKKAQSSACKGPGMKNPTFLEAYNRTKRLVNITCTPFKTNVKGSPPLILNFLTAPNVTLASAACASSCVPMLIEPVALLEKGEDGELRPYQAHSHSDPPPPDADPPTHNTATATAAAAAAGAFPSVLPPSHSAQRTTDPSLLSRPIQSPCGAAATVALSPAPLGGVVNVDVSDADEGRALRSERRLPEAMPQRQTQRRRSRGWANGVGGDNGSDQDGGGGGGGSGVKNGGLARGLQKGGYGGIRSNEEEDEEGEISDHGITSDLVAVVGSSEDEFEFDIPLEHIRMRDGSFESDVPVQAVSELFNCHFTIVCQVNPHIVPFFYHNRGRDGRPSTWRLWAGGWRGGFVLSALELWLKEDMLKSLRVLAGLDLLIEVFGVNWSYLYLQEARGDVTMIPDVRPIDYLYLIDNLTNQEELKRRVRAMELNTWQCLSRIEHRMSLQKALDKHCDSLGILDLSNDKD